MTKAAEVYTSTQTAREVRNLIKASIDSGETAEVTVTHATTSITKVISVLFKEISAFTTAVGKTKDGKDVIVSLGSPEEEQEMKRTTFIVEA